MSIDRVMDKEDVIHIINIILLNHKTGTKLGHFKKCRWILKTLTQSETSQKQKGKYHPLLYIFGI